MSQSARRWGEEAWAVSTISHRDFLALRRIPGIDGLRGFAILFVLAGHTGDEIWRHIHGTGVPIFFVNSGLLITILLLKEESRKGRIDLPGFYVRRAFRLLPIYFASLILYTLLVLIGLGENPGDWWERFTLFIFLQNEFATPGTFGHTWTLAMQEKFYIVWPFVGFLLISPIFRKSRLWLSMALAVGFTIAWIIWPTNYTVPLVPLMLGCTLAILLFDEQGFKIVAQATRPVVFIIVLVLAVLLKVFYGELPDISVPFSYLVVLLVPGIIFGAPWMGAPMRTRALVSIGTWAYSIYLLHPIVFSAISLIDPTGQHAILLQILRYLALVVGASAVGMVSYRVLEKPCIDLGARYSRRRAQRRAQD